MLQYLDNNIGKVFLSKHDFLRLLNAANDDLKKSNAALKKENEALNKQLLEAAEKHETQMTEAQENLNETRQELMNKERMSATQVSYLITSRKCF